MWKGLAIPLPNAWYSEHQYTLVGQGEGELDKASLHMYMQLSQVRAILNASSN